MKAPLAKLARRAEAAAAVAPDVAALLAAPPVADAVAETLAYLDSQEALASIAADPYWPKWSSPWWRLALLDELGLAARAPRGFAAAFATAVDRHYLRFFPLRVEELPPGKTADRDVICFCALGTLLRMLPACGVAVEQAIPWAVPYALRYRMADGGLNCDESAYLRPSPASSFLSTTTVAEGFLALARPLHEEERGFLSGVLRYLRLRGLGRSLRKGAWADPEWLALTFPRFYEYDLLRGLSLASRLAASLDEPIMYSELEGALAVLDAAFDPAAPLRLRAAHRACRMEPPPAARRDAATFPLLEAASGELGAALLRREWAETLLLLSKPGLVRG